MMLFIDVGLFIAVKPIPTYLFFLNSNRNNYKTITLKILKRHIAKKQQFQ